MVFIDMLEISMLIIGKAQEICYLHTKITVSLTILIQQEWVLIFAQHWLHKIVVSYKIIIGSLISGILLNLILQKCGSIPTLGLFGSQNQMFLKDLIQLKNIVMLLWIVELQINHILGASIVKFLIKTLSILKLQMILILLRISLTWLYHYMLISSLRNLLHQVKLRISFYIAVCNKLLWMIRTLESLDKE